MKNFAKIIIAILVIFFIAKSCKRSSHSSSSSPTPISILKGKLKNEQNYSIILEDMDAKNLNTSSEKYLHKYQILKERKDTVLVESTDLNRSGHVRQDPPGKSSTSYSKKKL